MTEQSILFSAPMILALLDGRKTQTRRLRWRKPSRKLLADISRLSGATADEVTGGPSIWQRARPGDRIWVREAHAISANPDRPLFYRAGHEEARAAGPRVDLKWRPSIHMPRWASRMTLVLTDVRVQRLQGISEADARAEGIADGGCLSCGCPEPCGCAAPTPSARDSFAALWNSLNGPDAWAKNPEVVALSFTVERSTQP